MYKTHHPATQPQITRLSTLLALKPVHSNFNIKEPPNTYSLFRNHNYCTPTEHRGRNKELTFPWATSSRCAADADLTSAAVAAAMDLAASRICSSKFRLSSAFCQGKRRQVLDDLAQQLTSLCQCHWQQAVCQTTDAFFLFFLNL